MNNIHPTAIIYPNVTIGDNNYIGAYAVIGSPPEDRNALSTNTITGVIIGSNNRINEYVTINAGTTQDTTIGNGCFLLRGSHIGHDCCVGDDVTISCNALVGGHSIIEDKVNFGLGAICHQYSKIKYGSMLGMGAILPKNKEVGAHQIWVGNPAKYLKDNERHKK